MVINIYLSRCLFITLSITCLFCGKTVHAQESGEKHVIRLTNETLTTTANAGAFLDNLKASQTSEEPVQVLIHFTELPTNAQRALLQQNGVTLLEYIPDNTYSALLVKSLNKEEVLSCPVYAIVNTKPEWKAGTYLWNSVRNKKTAVEVLVSFVPGVDPQKIREVITGLGGKINPGGMEKYGSYKVIIAANNVRTLADWYGVRNISPVTDIVPLDLESRPSMKGNVATSPAMYGGYGLTGDSVTVGVGDNASGIYHADLNDRITNFNPAPISKHGEHVNGIVGGAGNVDAFGVGMATHVSLLDFLYDLILPDEGIMYQDHNMTITNNSYEVIAGNCDYAGTYDGYSQFLDTLALQLPYMSNVFASGNDGLGNCTPFPAGFATVGGGYQPAKNNIVVGSMTDHYIEANDESRGPVRDGRLKPEIIAIGLVAYSTVLVDDYEWDAGTSMASPQVAGGMALLTQRYKQVNGGVQPRADLLKAILLNGTMDLGNPGPDYSFGYGAMDIYRSLQMIDSSNFTANDISNGDSQSFTINVPPGTGQLKVMLCWNDRPASASASKQLVNDLDLTVKDPSSIWHLPLGLDPTPANVNNNATEKPDHLNNTEQVTINNPTPGTFTIKTKGYSIPFGPQHYAVAYDIIPKALHLTYPLGGEQLFNGTSPFDSIRVFWDAVSDGNTFTIELSKDNGGSWITLSNNIGPDVRHLSWFPTGFSTSKVLIRLSRNGTSEVATSQRFTINDRPVVALDTAQCPGYINIHWSPVLNASGYYLLSKVGKYMQVVDSVTDTAYSFSGMSLTNKSYVAVQPIIEGMPGCRSIATITIDRKSVV